MNNQDFCSDVESGTRWRIGEFHLAVFVLGLLMAFLPLEMSFAQKEVPTWQSVVFLGLHPKNGQDFDSISWKHGPLKEYFETHYEGWWRDLGYWEADPETGRGIRGRYMDTRVDYEYEPLPWRFSPTGPSPASWGNASPLGAPRLSPDGRGEYNFEVDLDGQPVELYESGEPEPLLDGYWTPGERFYDTMSPPSDSNNDGITDLESTAPNGMYTREIPTEARWMPDVSGAPPPGLGLRHIEDEDNWSHVTGGEYFFDWDAGTDLSTDVIDCDGSNTMTVWVGYEVGGSRGNIAMELTDFDYVRQGNDGGIYPYFDIGDFEHNLMINTNNTLVVPEDAPGLITTNRMLDLHYYGGTDPLLTEVGEFTIWRWVRLSDGEFDGIIVSNATDYVKEEYLTVKVYQSGMLYGEPDGATDSGSSSLELVVDADYVLTPTSRTVVHGTSGSAPAMNASYYDANNNGEFDASSEFAWAGGAAWNGETVLTDAGDNLYNGRSGNNVTNSAFYLRAVWQDVGNDTIMDTGDNFWLETWDTANTNYLVMTNDSTDVNVYLGSSGDVNLPSTIAPVYEVTNMYFIDSLSPYNRFNDGETAWIDDITANGIYDCTPVVSLPSVAYNGHEGFAIGTAMTEDNVPVESLPVGWIDRSGEGIYSNRLDDTVWFDAQDDNTYQEYFYRNVPAPQVGLFENAARGPEWSIGKPGEQWEDYVNWWRWDTDGAGTGLWTLMITGVPASNDPEGVGYLPAWRNPDGMDPLSMITWNQYTNYISDNYPGDVQGVIDRTGNGEFDGADGFLDVISEEIVLQGYYTAGGQPVTCVEGGTRYGLSGWYGFSSYTNWFSTWFETANAPMWPSGSPNAARAPSWNVVNVLSTNAYGGQFRSLGVVSELTDATVDSFAAGTYNGTLQNTPVVADSITLRLGGLVLTDTPTDPANPLFGELNAPPGHSATNIYSGTIDYQTGAFSITLSGPASQPSIESVYADYDYSVNLGATGTDDHTIVQFGAAGPEEVSIPINTYPAAAYPPDGMSWGYDAPREFIDLPSSMYHTYGVSGCGDLRFSEELNVWDDTLNPVDRGANSTAANASGPDYVIAPAGPVAYNIHGLHGLDVGSQAIVEYLTWRTDGQHLVGPTSVHSAVGQIPPLNAGDKRDVDLDGYIDQGESIPAGSANYLVDYDPTTPDDGQNTRMPFGWERWMEDMVEIWDSAEDFMAVNTHGSIVDPADADRTVVDPAGPSGDSLSDGTTTEFGQYLHETLGYPIGWYQGDTIPNGALSSATVYDPAAHELWRDINSNMQYDVEYILNTAASLSNGVPSDFALSGRYYDVDGGGDFDMLHDFAWDDANPDNAWTTEFVLSDQNEDLHNGLGGNAILSGYYLRVCWQDVDGTTNINYGDNFWVETSSTGSIGYASNSYDGTDIMLHVGDSGSLTETNLNVYNLTNVLYVDGDLNGTYNGGESTWIDADFNDVYDCDPVVKIPDLSFGPHTGYKIGSFISESGGASAILPLGVSDTDGSGTYTARVSDVVWWDSVNPVGEYNREELIPDGVTNSIPRFASGLHVDNLGWEDRAIRDNDPNSDSFGEPLAPDGVFTPLDYFAGGQALIPQGDALWIDGNSNRTFDVANIYGVPVYGVGLREPGAGAPPVYFSGNSFRVPTRDGVFFGGGNQCQEVFSPALLCHEQGHDLMGWPDLYDYDRYDPDYYNFPIGGYDVMSDGDIVHSTPSLKTAFGVSHKNLKSMLVQGLGMQTIKLYPIERVPDQYYTFSSGNEQLQFWYQNGGSVYSDPGGKGVHIAHIQGGNQYGGPLQQRIGNRFSYRIIQADGLMEMEDGLDTGGPDDVFPGTTGSYLFTEDTNPASRWWDGTSTGIRILDIRMSSNPEEPAEVDFEWIFTGNRAWKNITTESFHDSDNDGIPDAWEYHWFQDYPDPLDEASAGGDWDGDGLPDYAEWLAGLNPKVAYSYTNTVNDADADIDGDGLSNLEEYSVYGTDMRNPDTDDDGISDGDEVNGASVNGGREITSPVYSRSPLINRSLVLTDTNRLVIPSWQIDVNDPHRFELPEWTLNAWIKLDSTNVSGTIVQRVTAQDQVNFELGLTNNLPYARFTTAGGAEARVQSQIAIETGIWTRVAGVWSRERSQVELYRDNTMEAATGFLGQPALGSDDFRDLAYRTGTTYLGGNGFHGKVDDVQIWGSAPEVAFVENNYNQTVNTPWFGGSISTQVVTGGETFSVIAELTGTGDGSSTTYSGSISNSPVVAGSLTIQAGIYPFNDNGTGGLSSPARANFLGSINYNTGAWSINTGTNVAVGAGELIQASYDYQTATQVAQSNVVVSLNQSLYNDGSLIAYLRFDDGENTSITNRLSGSEWDYANIPEINHYGAEDYVHLNDFKYAVWGEEIAGVEHNLNKVVLNFTNDTPVIVGETSLYNTALDDLDEDGIPDWWQKLFWPSWSPRTTGPWGPDEDVDDDGVGDGVPNFYEYIGNTHPMVADSDGNGVIDYNEDSDNDGLKNGDEWTVHESDAWLVDTDDDGIGDYDEVQQGSNPASSLSPQNQGVLAVDGAGYVDYPRDARFAVNEWTVEAWVRPDAYGGSIAYRSVEPGVTNFYLGLDGAGHVVCGFGTNYLQTSAIIPLDAGATNWTHIAGSFAKSGQILRIFTNGLQAAEMALNEAPVNRGPGPRDQRVGFEFDGQIDEFRLWSRALSETTISNQMQGVLSGTELGLVSYYRFDDSTAAAGTSGNINWTWGQVEEFAQGYQSDWLREWRNAGTLNGGASLTNIAFSESPYEVVADSDGDGLPDWWENLYPCLDSNDATGDYGRDGDPDGDGATNIEEYGAGTDPCSPDVLGASWVDSTNAVHYAPGAILDLQVGHSVSINVTRPAFLSDTEMDLGFIVSDSSLFQVLDQDVSFAIDSTNTSVNVTGVGLGQGAGSGQGTLRIVSSLGQVDVSIQMHAGDALLLNMGGSSNIVAGNTATMTVTRDRSVGSKDQPLTVNIDVSDETLLNAPNTVTIPGGYDSASFTLMGLKVSSGVVVRASAGGYPSVSYMLDVLPSTLTTYVDGLVVTNIPVHAGGRTTVEIERPVSQSAGQLILNVGASDPSVYTVATHGADTGDGSLDVVFNPGQTVARVDLLGHQLGDGSGSGGTTLTFELGEWNQYTDVTLYMGQELRVTLPEGNTVVAGDSMPFSVERIPTPGVPGPFGQELPFYLTGYDDGVITRETENSFNRNDDDKEGFIWYNSINTNGLRFVFESPGYPSTSINLIFTEPTITIDMQPGTISRGDVAVLQITRGADETGGELTFQLSVTDDEIISIVPDSNVTAQGDGTFEVRFVQGQQVALVNVEGLGTGTASVLISSGTFTAGENLTVVARPLTLSSATVVVGDRGTMTVSRDPSLVDEAINVELQSLSPSYVSLVSDTTLINTGNVAAVFDIIGLQQTTNAYIQASADQYDPAQGRVTVLDPSLSFDAAPYTVEITAESEFTVTRPTTESGASLSVEMTSGDTNIFTVQSSVNFLEGQSTVSGTIIGGTNTALIGNTASLVASVGSYAVTSTVELTDLLPSIRDIDWYDNDEDELYSAGDDLMLEFSVPMNIASVTLAELLVYAQSSGSWAIEPTANYGAGASIVAADAPTGIVYQITLGTSPNLRGGWGIDPTTNVVDSTARPDATTPPAELPTIWFGADSDGDGMPDEWEIDNGLSPSDPTGSNGAWGDPDSDGLCNLWEYKAFLEFGVNLDPLNADTDDDGFSDYDSRRGPNTMTWGELYDDGDSIPDLWESLYMGIVQSTGRQGLDPSYYDADLDPDEDGWSNYAEYMGMTGTNANRTKSSDPTDPNSMPKPQIELRIRYNGIHGSSFSAAITNNPGAVARLEFFDDASMDDYIIGRISTDQNIVSTYALDEGNLVEGDNYILGYLDLNMDGSWNATNEPGGVACANIGWGDVDDIEVALADRLQGYPRFDWTTLTTYSDKYMLELWQGDTRLLTRTVDGSFRSYMHEGDYLYDGRYGLAPGTYNLRVYYMEEVLGHLYTNILSTHVSIVDPAPLSEPVFSTGNGSTFVYSRNQIQWTSDQGATAYTLQIAETEGGTPLVTLTDRTPYKNLQGNYSADLPIYAGFEYGDGNVWDNRTYYMRMFVTTPTDFRASDWNAFTFNLESPSQGGKSMINGDIYYFGKVTRGYIGSAPADTNLKVVVETFMSEGFSGKPDGRYLLSANCSTNNMGLKGAYQLAGLHNGIHYVRAFVDLDGDRKLDYFEPYGFAKRTLSDPSDYEAMEVNLSGTVGVLAEDIDIVIRDRDTDDDGLPDGWEWMNWGHLGYNGHDDPDNDLADNLAEYNDGDYDSDPTNPDTDGDGLLDGYEIEHGLNTHSVDSDGDGLRDDYEVSMGLDPLDPYADKDGDGIIDADEVLVTNTDPNDAEDVLRIEGATAGENVAEPGSSEVVIQWNGKEGVSYQVQYCEDLLQGWQNATGGRADGAGTHSYVDAENEKTRYYRILAW